jgi:tetratricopeptide (TPR) repeat protein
MATKKKIISELVSDAGKVVEAPKVVRETQLQVFDRAAKLFRAQHFREARELFLKASEGEVREVAHNARLHIMMCNRRLDKPDVQLKSIDDFYNVGVERLNARDYDGARKILQQAIDLTKKDGDSADHVYYAMAACQAMTGDWRGAYENLKRAIEIEPRNRVAARQDPDFFGSAQQTSIQTLLHPDKSPF